MTGRVKIAVAIAAAMLGASSAAQAAPFDSGLYAVIDYAGVIPKWSAIKGISTPSYLDGVEADIGWRFNPFYSVELSYDYNTGSTTSHDVDFDATLQAISLDGMGYLPLGRNSHWALYADAGGSLFIANGGTPTMHSGDETRLGGRVGGGLLYQFSDDLGVRASGRYEFTDVPNIKSAEIFSVGLVWQQ